MCHSSLLNLKPNDQMICIMIRYLNVETVNINLKPTKITQRTPIPKDLVPPNCGGTFINLFFEHYLVKNHENKYF